MFTKDELKQLGEVIDQKIEPIKKQLTDQGKKLDTLELKIAAIQEQNTKDHTEIMDKLAESNEINGKLYKDHENRIIQLEEDAEFPRSH